MESLVISVEVFCGDRQLGGGSSSSLGLLHVDFSPNHFEEDPALRRWLSESFVYYLYR